MFSLHNHIWSVNVLLKDRTSLRIKLPSLMINGQPALPSEVQPLVMRNVSFYIMKDCIKKAYTNNNLLKMSDCLLLR